jgi:ABC-type antimicrobial peptide transport system permease subunit
LAIGFGVIAMILAGVGVFGVLWFHVSRRTKEIGIRMALGAQRADALRLVLRQSFVMTGIAVGIGLPLAVAAAWLLRAQFYGVGATDPRALLGSAALLSAIAIVAGVVPSQRASRVDPLIALREDG